MSAIDRRHNARTVRAATGPELSAKSWLTEAPLRMLMNNLDPDVAENPNELVVYGGIGRAARTWDDFERITTALRALEGDQTLLVQSGKPVGVFRTHKDAPRVLIANSNFVPHWATWDHFNELDKRGLAMYGQMIAGSRIYIGTQGIVQGTYETFVEAGRQHYGGSLKGKWILTGGLGGLGGAPRALSEPFEATGPDEWLVTAAPFSHGEFTFFADLPGADEARHLGVDPKEPVLVGERRTWLGSRPVTYVRMVHPRAHRLTSLI